MRDVPSQAKKGEIKEVADGYARNFLLPRGIALLAKQSTIRTAQVQLQQKAKDQALKQSELAEVARQIDGTRVRFRVRVGARKRLFGSITATDIAQELRQLTGFAIDKRRIELDEPLRELGSHEIVVRLSKDIEAKVKVLIEEEES